MIIPSVMGRQYPMTVEFFKVSAVTPQYSLTLQVLVLVQGVSVAGVVDVGTGGTEDVVATVGTTGLGVVITGGTDDVVGFVGAVEGTVEVGTVGLGVVEGPGLAVVVVVPPAGVVVVSPGAAGAPGSLWASVEPGAATRATAATSNRNFVGVVNFIVAFSWVKKVGRKGKREIGGANEIKRRTGRMLWEGE